MSDAVVVRQHGGPEVLKLEAIEVGSPKHGELRIRQTYLGVNFHDVYVRSGLYKTMPLPGIPGIEGVGLVEAVGGGVTGFAVGDRVAYVTSSYGCYASDRLVPAAICVRLPDAIDDRVAASVLLKGLTVEMLLKRVHRVRRSDWVLVQAAAGGVGQLLVQWATHLGAKVIGTAGTPQKADVARRAGCCEVILYRQESVLERVRAITDGSGVDVVYDSVGKDTFLASLESLSLCGHLVNFGQSSGLVEPIAMSQLATRSSTVSRPMVFHYVAERAALEEMSSALFAVLAEGNVKAEKPVEYPLEAASHAHAFLESRKAMGPIILRT